MNSGPLQKKGQRFFDRLYMDCFYSIINVER